MAGKTTSAQVSCRDRRLLAEVRAALDAGASLVLIDGPTRFGKRELVQQMIGNMGFDGEVMEIVAIDSKGTLEVLSRGGGGADHGGTGHE